MQARKTHKDKTQSTASVKPDAAEVVAPAVVPAAVVPAMHQVVSFVCGSLFCLSHGDGKKLADSDEKQQTTTTTSKITTWSSGRSHDGCGVGWPGCAQQQQPPPTPTTT